jgi:1-aminocyclopropane-1-carboxylate deaminase
MTEFSANSAFTQQINEILRLPSPLQSVNDKVFEENNLRVYVKRDDVIHPEISGNKWRKLKYNLLNAKQNGYEGILTFGGAYSNHIYATAAAGKYFGFETIGIIRGDELNENSSETLKFASKCGMKLHFVSRNEYRSMRENPKGNSFIQTYTHSKLVPEGGTNEFALAGVGEMVDEISEQLGAAPDYIICPVGTAGTISGIISNTNSKTKIIGVCVLKNGQYLQKEIAHLVMNKNDIEIDNLEMFWNFHHGGYAKKTPELIDFVSNFNTKHDFEIEPIYSGKMFFAFFELLKQNYFASNSTIVLIHTGGLRPKF